MEFDENCQLRPKPVADEAPGEDHAADSPLDDMVAVSDHLAAAAASEQTSPNLNFNDDKQHEIDSAHMVDEKELVEEPIKRRASADRQPTLKGERLAVVGGKDAANPFREGSKSHAAFAYLQANHGSTYEELKAAGVRMRAITHSKKEGWIRTL